MPAIAMKLRDTSDCNFRYDITNEVSHLSEITGHLTIQPRHLLLRFTPDTEGSWCLDLVTVFGMPVINGKVKERKRLSDIMFMRPLDGEDTENLPKWLEEIAEHHVMLMNPEFLHDRQRQAARKVARKYYEGEIDHVLSDEIADEILTAIQRVG